MFTLTYKGIEVALGQPVSIAVEPVYLADGSTLFYYRYTITAPSA